MFNRKPIKIKLAFKSPHWVILIRNNSFGKQWDYVRSYEKLETIDEWKEKVFINPVKVFDTLKEAEEYINKFFTSKQPKVNIFYKLILGIKQLFTKNPNTTDTKNNISNDNKGLSTSIKYVNNEQ